LTYLPYLQAASKSHTHSNDELGCANSKKGYNSYYQSLLAVWKRFHTSTKEKKKKRKDYAYKVTPV